MEGSTHTLLIADRNLHVREFLKRELAKTGYQVYLAENGKDMLQFIFQNKRVELIILDPDMPDIDQTVLADRLKNRVPCVFVVIHAFSEDTSPCWKTLDAVEFVEKDGNSIERLKKLIADYAVSS